LWQWNFLECGGTTPLFAARHVVPPIKEINPHHNSELTTFSGLDALFMKK